MAVAMADRKDRRRGETERERTISPRLRRGAVNNRFGRWLIDELEARNVDIAWLCGVAGMSHSTVYKALEYVDPTPDIPTLLRIGKALDVPVVNLYALLRYFDGESLERVYPLLLPRVREMLEETQVEETQVK